MRSKQGETRGQNETDVVGGYMLHSPQSRRATGKLAFGQQVFTVLIVGALAAYTGHFSVVTAAVFGTCLALVPIVRLINWETLPPLAFIPYLWASAGIYVVMAFDFNEPDVLLSLYTTVALLANTFWYKRWLLVLNLGALFGIFSVGSVMIAGRDELATVLLTVPITALIVIRLGLTSNRYLSMQLSRTRFRATVKSLLHALHARDGYTAEHSEITVRMAAGVGGQLGLDAVEQAELKEIALLHDIGKIGVPNSVLHKPGKLDEREWEIMRQHPVIGEQILAEVPGFKDISRAVRHEHERWDGAGYPDGIAGNEIPLASRIVLACDAYHAMTSNRPYREAMRDEDARTELMRNAGTQFDPRVVTALLRALDDDVMLDTPEDLGGAEVSEKTEGSTDGAADVPAPLIVARNGEAPEHGPTKMFSTGRSRDGEGGEVNLANDLALMLRSVVVSCPLVTVVLGAYLVAFSKVDLFGIAAMAGPIAILIVSLLVARHHFAKTWYGMTVVLAYVFTPIVAVYYREPAMMLFLLAPATFTPGFNWHTRRARVLQIVAATIAFGVLPVALFGFDELVRSLIGTRAFLGALLVVGYLANRMADMEFERERFASTTASLLLALHARDDYTATHSSETVAMALGVADRLGFNDAERDELANIAILHDIGKIGVPDEILHKPGKLDEREWEIMRQHPVIGEQIVAQVPGYEALARAIRHEHERWDGNGYPDGLTGRDIPLASRIVLACDAFHAMTSDRPYRPAMPDVAARSELLSNVGTQFDPEVVTALLAVLDGGEATRASRETGDYLANDSRRVNAA